MAPQSFSPLFKIKKILLILRCFLGFPLKGGNEEFNEFVFRPVIEYPRYAVFIILYFGPQFYNLYVFTADNPSKNMIEISISYSEVALGYTALDLMIVMWIPIVCLTSATFYLISFKKKTSDINHICLEMTMVKELLSDVLIKTGDSNKKSKMNISLRLFISALIIWPVILVLYCGSMYLTMSTVFVNEVSFAQPQMWLVMINDLISSFCWIYPTIAMSADLVTCHILEEMGDIYLSWNNVLVVDLVVPDTDKYSVHHSVELKDKENSETQRMKRPTDLSVIVDQYIDDSEISHDNQEEKGEEEDSKRKTILSIGASLLKITRKIDKSFEGIILNTYINCLIQATSTLYAGSSFFFNKLEGVQNYILTPFCFLLTFLSILRLLHYTKAGQYLATSMEECTETLKDIQMISPDEMNFNCIKVLKQDMKDKAASPINPFSAFSLSNSTLIGTFATILTYLIVLVQFKAAENQDKDKILLEIKEMLRYMNITLQNATLNIKPNDADVI